MAYKLVFADVSIDGPDRSDFAFNAAIIILWGLGILTLYVASANYGQRLFDDPLYFVIRQLLFSLIGFLFFLFFAHIPLERIRTFLPVLVIGSLALCLLVFVPGFGVERNGARRWIQIPFLTAVQPSETAKLAVILFLANLLAKRGELPEASESITAPVAGLVTMVLVIFLQRDFSTGLFILLLGIILFFASGVRIGWFLAFCFLALPASLFFVFMEPYRVNRLIAFVRPEFDLYGLNYQSNAARMAIGAGGLFGQGIGAGLTQIRRIPEVQADYIFAGWSESMGFLGVISYFVLLVFFACRGFVIAFRCPNSFGSLTAFGCTASIFFQSLINCAVVCSALPSTGIPLPFFSSGGSSMIITFCMCGLIVNISRIQAAKEELW
ncbi:MAG: putative lipid II flippase FtsW [Treponema sp.]|jgi:cell division protein FtsW|nr:putative lipid II flippase FtsW [Treponema sp.]